MEKELMDYVKEKTADLLAAPMCCKELRAAAEAWLAALGTDEEAAATKAYVAELEADIMPVDGLIAFTESDAGPLRGRTGRRHGRSRPRPEGRRPPVLRLPRLHGGCRHSGKEGTAPLRRRKGAGPGPAFLLPAGPPRPRRKARAPRFDGVPPP